MAFTYKTRKYSKYELMKRTQCLGSFFKSRKMDLNKSWKNRTDDSATSWCVLEKVTELSGHAPCTEELVR